MTGFADLVLTASSTTGGRLADVNLDGTEGRTWKWTFEDITDIEGEVIDLSGVTGVAKIVAASDGSEILALTFTGGSGTFTLSATAAETAGLAVGATMTRPRKCLWYCKLTSGSNVVQAWGPSSSNFRIYPE